MVSNHIKATNGGMAPGIQLSFQAVSVLLTVGALLFTVGLKVVAMDKEPVVRAIDTNAANIAKLNHELSDLRERQEQVNRRLLEGVSRIEGMLEEHSKQP